MLLNAVVYTVVLFCQLIVEDHMHNSVRQQCQGWMIFGFDTNQLFVASSRSTSIVPYISYTPDLHYIGHHVGSSPSDTGRGPAWTAYITTITSNGASRSRTTNPNTSRDIHSSSPTSSEYRVYAILDCILLFHVWEQQRAASDRYRRRWKDCTESDRAGCSQAKLGGI